MGSFDMDICSAAIASPYWIFRVLLESLQIFFSFYTVSNPKELVKHLKIYISSEFAGYVMLHENLPKRSFTTHNLAYKLCCM